MAERPTGERLARGIRNGRGIALSYKATAIDWPQLRSRIEGIDEALNAVGLGEGAIVAIPGRNNIPAATACLAAVSTRRCAALVNPFKPIDRMLEAARGCAAAAILVEEADLDVGDFAPGDTVFVLMEGGHTRLHSRGASSKQSAPNNRLVLSTSGTTGEPKRIAISDETVARALDEIALFNRGFGDRPDGDGCWPGLIQYSPLAHVGGTLTLLRGAAQSRRIAMLEKFEPYRWTELVRELRPATTGLPPAMMRMVLEANLPDEAFAGLVSVWSGSAPVKADETATFTTRYGLPVLGNYGATEYCGAVATWSLEDYHLHHGEKGAATGRVLPAIAEARVRGSETGEILPVGETGVLELRIHRVGPHWMTTTDLAHLDTDGFLFLHGRSDDAIVRGGFKLRPETIADTLRLHPKVRDVAVVGVPDRRLGQVPVAAIERANGEEAPSETELIAFVKANLPAYFAPVAIRQVEALPRTPAMKVDRRAVRALFGDLS